MADQLEDTLAEICANGGRVTPARRAVPGAILNTGEHHVTATEVFVAVEKIRPRAGRSRRP